MNCEHVSSVQLGLTELIHEPPCKAPLQSDLYLDRCLLGHGSQQ